jgi:hypothetical protein
MRQHPTEIAKGHVCHISRKDRRMDCGHFDAFARLVATVQSRRAALTALLGLTLLGHEASPVVAKHRNKVRRRKAKRRKRKSRRRIRAERCGIDFTTANLIGADFRGGNLSRACLVGADLRAAKIDATTNLEGATFCHTFMPDGSVNNSNCNHRRRCCPTEFLPQAGDRGVAFQSIKNNTKDRTFTLDIYYYPVGYNQNEGYWHHSETHRLGPGEDYNSILPYRKQAIYVNGKYWAYIQNLVIGAPLGQVGDGGSITRNAGWKDWHIVKEESMPNTGQQISEFIDDVLIVLRKVDDNSNNINWSLQIQTLSG